MTPAAEEETRAARAVKVIVRAWREFDGRVNRPLPDDRRWIWRFLAPSGIAWYFPALAAAAVAGMALGPRLVWGWPQALLLAAGAAGLALVHLRALRAVARLPSDRYLPQLCGGYLAVLLAMVVWLLARAAPETLRAPGLRLHIGAALVLAMIVGLGAARLIVRSLLNTGRAGALAPSLARTDLFSPRERYQGTRRGWIVTATFFALLRYPDRILLPPALVMLATTEGTREIWGRGWEGERWILLLVAAVPWALVVMGLLHERLMEMLETIGRLAFTGPQRAVTWLVIAIAALRVVHVHYVNYLFTGESWAIMLYLGFAYVVAWFYGFWCDVFFATRLLCALAPPAGGETAGPFRYRVLNRPEARARGADPAAAAGRSPYSSVLRSGRSLVLHGAGRIKVEGVHEPEYRAAEGIGPRALALLTPAQLMGQIRSQAENRPAAGGDTMRLLRDVQRAAMVYPTLTAALAVLLLALPGYYTFRHSTQPAELVIRPVGAAQDGSLRLEALLTGEGEGAACPVPPGAPRLLLAASGGGSRAALYTYAVLRGLAEEGRICQLVAASGVSGGAAALAYFATHHADLRRPPPLDAAGAQAWDAFAAAMQTSYIEDVLDELGSLRLAYGRWSWSQAACGEPAADLAEVENRLHPARTRPGNLLAEDFACTFGHATFDDLPFGLILNTGLLGRFDTEDTPCEAKGATLAERARLCADKLDGTGAGGRLVLTNLPRLDARGGADRSGIWLRTLNQPGISLARAAALSANFPPVFPDAAIDVTADGTAGQRYWVTDGGAVENRAAVTLYVALRDAADRLAARRAAGDPTAALPAPVELLIADASATPDPYSESFGLRSATGAGAQLALAMEAELRHDIEVQFEGFAQTFRVHELPMPRTLLDAIGTHWRLPEALVIGSGAGLWRSTLGQWVATEWPRAGKVIGGEAPVLRLSRADTVRLFECLYRPEGRPAPDFANPAEVARVLARMRAEPGTWRDGEAWRRLMVDLGRPRPGPLCVLPDPSPG